MIVLWLCFIFVLVAYLTEYRRTKDKNKDKDKDRQKPKGGDSDSASFFCKKKSNSTHPSLSEKNRFDKL